MSIETYQELIWQLDRLPGGASAAIPDFFGALLDAPVTADAAHWPLREAGTLALDESGRLSHEGSAIAELPAELRAAAQTAGVSTILLGLLALAVGHVDGERRLKACLPRVDAAAKDLMLMTVCRLCG